MPKIVRTKLEFEGEVREKIAVVEEGQVPPWRSEAQFQFIGQSLPRVGGERNVTGSALYTSDIVLPGMLHSHVLRSPVPHAEIESIDLGAAAQLPGVRAVLAHPTAPRIRWFGDSLLFDRVFRYEGDEVAAVAADEEEIAADAVGLIDVRYRELPFVVDPEEAMRPGSPRIHVSGNLAGGPTGEVYERGDIEKGFGRAALVIEERYETQAAVHNSLEPHCSVARWDGDELTLWTSTQHVYGVRNEIADVLGIPLHHVRVICEFMGGGFGSKQGLGKHDVIAALLAKITGRPVKLVLNRRDENLTGGVRHSTIQYLKAGVNRNGRLVALQLRSVANIGAFGFGSSEVGGPVRELYRCPNVRTEQLAVHTNIGPSVAFRAPGYVEGMFALESLMDQIASTLKIDPLELRLLNYADRDPVGDARYSSKPLKEAYRRGANIIGWDERALDSSVGSKRRGIGMASQIWGGGGGPPAYAIVRMNADGTADLLTGSQDIGTGTKTVLTQIAAEELGLRLEDVRITVGDSRAGPYAPVSAGSMTVPSMGPAVRAAARQAREDLASLASDLLRVHTSSLTIKDRRISSNGLDGPVSVSEIMGRLGDFMVIGKGAREPNLGNIKVRTFGAQFADIEVDIDTGEVTVNRVVAVHDFGRVINPMTLSSQVEGGIMQGMGFALMEMRWVDPESGKSLNPNLEAYKIPTMLDVPLIDADFINRADEKANSIGAKGAGEPPIIPTAAAIANAIFAATGIRVRSLPITREKMLDGLKQVR